MLRKKRCCQARPCGLGFFMIAIGLGLFMAYVIPRYLLITLLGLVFIGTGICMLVKR